MARIGVRPAVVVVSGRSGEDDRTAVQRAERPARTGPFRHVAGSAGRSRRAGRMRIHVRIGESTPTDRRRIVRPRHPPGSMASTFSARRRSAAYCDRTLHPPGRVPTAVARKACVSPTLTRAVYDPGNAAGAAMRVLIGLATVDATRAHRPGRATRGRPRPFGSPPAAARRRRCRCSDTEYRRRATPGRPSSPPGWDLRLRPVVRSSPRGRRLRCRTRRRCRG